MKDGSIKQLSRTYQVNCQYYIKKYCIPSQYYATAYWGHHQRENYCRDIWLPTTLLLKQIIPAPGDSQKMQLVMGWWELQISEWETTGLTMLWKKWCVCHLWYDPAGILLRRSAGKPVSKRGHSLRNGSAERNKDEELMLVHGGAEMKKRRPL